MKRLSEGNVVWRDVSYGGGGRGVCGGREGTGALTYCQVCGSILVRDRVHISDS